MAEKNRVQIVKDRFNALSKEKKFWLPLYQLVGEYVLTRKQNFLSSGFPGEFLTEQLFSSVAPQANRDMASAIMGNLWPDGARSIRIVRPRNIPDSPQVREYYTQFTETLVDVLDAPEANFSTALDEYLLDQGSFGISGIQREKTGNIFEPFRFKSVNVKFMVVEENKFGVIDTIYIDKEFTVRTLVEEYGFENVSKRYQESFTAGKTQEKVRVIHLIEPRREIGQTFGNKNFPIASFHFEWDSNKILRESGFKEPPLIVSRFLKAMGETYGRSPAMFALPAILRLNMFWEIMMKAVEKRINPPLYLLDNGALGSTIVDTSPGGMSVFNVTGLGEKSPVGQLFDVGDMQGSFQLEERLTDQISKAFYLDKLLDLNNQSRMTLGEAQIRDRIRGEALSSIFRRQMNELFNPLLTGTINELFDMGILGVIQGSDKERELLNQGIKPIIIPDEVVRAIQTGQKIYEIKYISPAIRILQTEKLQGITTTWDIALTAGNAISDILDNLDPDVTMKKVVELTAVDQDLLRDSETIKKIREIRAQQIQAQQQMAQTQAGADAVMKISQAQSMRQGAINDRPRG